MKQIITNKSKQRRLNIKSRITLKVASLLNYQIFITLIVIHLCYYNMHWGLTPASTLYGFARATNKILAFYKNVFVKKLLF